MKSFKNINSLLFKILFMFGLMFLIMPSKAVYAKNEYFKTGKNITVNIYLKKGGADYVRYQIATFRLDGNSATATINADAKKNKRTPRAEWLNTQRNTTLGASNMGGKQNDNSIPHVKSFAQAGKTHTGNQMVNLATNFPNGNNDNKTRYVFTYVNLNMYIPPYYKYDSYGTAGTSGTFGIYHFPDGGLSAGSRETAWKLSMHMNNTGIISVLDGGQISGASIDLRFSKPRNDVTFNGNNGTVSYTVKTYDYGDTIAFPSASRANYKFKEWNTKSDGTGTKYTTGSKMPSTAITLYAIWTYNAYAIKYNNNGGTGTIGNQTVDLGGSGNITLSNGSGFSKSYSTLAGWNTAANGSGTNYNLSASVARNKLSSTAGATVDLYARWTPWKYTIAYNKNATAATGTIDNRTVDLTSTASFTLPSSGFTYNNRVFTGWNTKADGTGTNVPSGASVTSRSFLTTYMGISNITADNSNGKTFTLYAKWRNAKYTIVYEKNPEGFSVSGTIADQTADMTASSITLPSSGYTRSDDATLSGWNTRADGTGTFYNKGASVNPTSIPGAKDGATVKLYAVWALPRYTIKYDNNGGSGTIADQNTIRTDLVALSNGSGFSKTNYTFIGWAKTMHTTFTDYLPGASVRNLTNGNVITLYAVWRRNGTGFIQRPLLDEKMFYKDFSILGEAGTKYIKEKIDSRMAHIDTNADPGYFTFK